MQILFSQQDRAGSFQAANDFRVFDGNPIFENKLAAVVRTPAVSIKSFRAEGNTVQRLRASRRAESRLRPGGPAPGPIPPSP